MLIRQILHVKHPLIIKRQSSRFSSAVCADTLYYIWDEAGKCLAVSNHQLVINVQ